MHEFIFAIKVRSALGSIAEECVKSCTSDIHSHPKKIPWFGRTCVIHFSDQWIDKRKVGESPALSLQFLLPFGFSWGFEFDSERALLWDRAFLIWDIGCCHGGTALHLYRYHAHSSCQTWTFGFCQMCRNPKDNHCLNTVLFIVIGFHLNLFS